MPTTPFHNNVHGGIAVIELLIAIAMIACIISSIMGLASISLEASHLTKQTTQARALAEEALETARNFRDGIGWNNDDPENKYDGLGVLAAGVSYHPAKSQDPSPRWMLLTGEETIGGFTRKLVFEDVSRDDDDDIETVYNPNRRDPDTKKVSATVFWQGKGGQHQVKITTYLTNWR